MVAKQDYSQIGPPIWASDELKYVMDEKYERQINLTIPLGNSTNEEKFYSQMYRANATLFLHVMVSTPNYNHPDFEVGKPLAGQPLLFFRNS